MAETLFRQWFIEEAKEDWEEVRIGDLCEVITKGTTPKQFAESGVNKLFKSILIMSILIQAYKCPNLRKIHDL